MRIKFKNFLCIFTGLAAFLGASNADTMFSKYGIIQNVQNYSSNPFWNPNSPYNNRMPQPVYATGPQVKTDECQRIVTSLVTLQCMNANNCIGARIDDIRPAIILQLSRMTGGNYATACAGYLDGIFNDYVSQFANAAPNGTPSKFPTPAAPNTNANGNQIQLSNPFATPAPDWATDMRERQLELQALHTETGTNNHQIQSAEFPTTYADVSFTDRLENARNGYEPFKDARAYREMDIEDEETYLARIENSKKKEKEKEKEKKEGCTPKTCHIKYELKDGTKDEDSPDTHTTCNGDTKLEEPSRKGFKFGGWYTDQKFASDKKTEISDEDCKTNDDTITLYAKWTAGTPCTPKKCTITYELDDGTNNNDNPDKFTTCGNSVTLKRPTKTANTFDGWYTKADFSGDPKTEIIEGDCANNGDTITLYAKWTAGTPCTPKTCKIVYELDGGKNHDDNPDEFTTCGDPVTLKRPTKTANTFDAWYTDQNFAGDKKITKIENKHCANNGDTIKIYAHWATNNIPITCGDYQSYTHDFDEDATGKYAILVQPYASKQWKGTEYKLVKNTKGPYDYGNHWSGTNKRWWNKNCSDYDIENSGIDDDAPVNNILREIRKTAITKSPNRIEYWINESVHSPQGLIMTDHGNIQSTIAGRHVMKFNNLKDALCTANLLANTMKNTACKNPQLHLYVVELLPDNKYKIVGPDDTSGTDKKGDGYKAF